MAEGSSFKGGLKTLCGCFLLIYILVFYFIYTCHCAIWLYISILYRFST